MKHSITIALVLAVAASAAADTKGDADRLFKQGKRLMAEKKFAEACQAFEQSFRLDPGIGGELNTARCYEEWGKLARALAAYQQAEEMAKSAKDPREPKIHALVAELDPKVPRITLKLSGGADAKDVKITIDDKPLDSGQLGQPQLVDPGPHTVAYESAGKKKKKIVPVERGGSSEIVLDVTPVAVVPGPPNGKDKDKDTEPASREPADPGKNRKLAAYATGGAGVVLVGISSYMTLSARSQYNDALSQHCMNMTNMCDPTGLSATHDARHEANIATVVFLVGAAAVGGGVALYLTAPKASRRDEHALYLVPTVTPDSAALVLGGRL